MTPGSGKCIIKHNCFIISLLDEAAIPPDYLLHDFKRSIKLGEHDIFTYGTSSLENRFKSAIKAHIQECPESIGLQKDWLVIAICIFSYMAQHLFTFIVSSKEIL